MNQSIAPGDAMRPTPEEDAAIQRVVKRLNDELSDESTALAANALILTLVLVDDAIKKANGGRPTGIPAALRDAAMRLERGDIDEFLGPVLQ